MWASTDLLGLEGKGVKGWDTKQNMLLIICSRCCSNRELPDTRCPQDPGPQVSSQPLSLSKEVQKEQLSPGPRG